MRSSLCALHSIRSPKRQNQHEPVVDALGRPWRARFCHCKSVRRMPRRLGRLVSRIARYSTGLVAQGNAAEIGGMDSARRCGPLGAITCLYDKRPDGLIRFFPGCAAKLDATPQGISRPES